MWALGYYNYKLGDHGLSCFMQELGVGKLQWISGQHIENHRFISFLHTARGIENVTTTHCACKCLSVVASTFRLLTHYRNQHHCHLLIYTVSHLLFQSEDQAGIIP